MFAAIKKIVIFRQASRLHRVLSRYMSSVQCLMDVSIPKAMDLYRDIGETIIDKTVEDPQPMLDLLNAVEKCVGHYGPGIIADIARYKKSFNSADADKVKEKVNALCQAVLDIQRDVH